MKHRRALSAAALLGGLCLVFPCPASAMAFGFASLPSAQGWTYSSGQGLVEEEVFAADGSQLTIDTTGSGLAAAGYGMANVLPLPSFTLFLTARVLVDEGGGRNFGFSTFSSESVQVRLGTNALVVVGQGPGSLIPLDGTTFHDYRLEVTVGVGFELFVDGVPVASGRGNPGSGNSVFFGDGNAIDPFNTLAEITRFEIVPQPPVTLVVVSGLLGFSLARKRS